MRTRLGCLVAVGAVLGWAGLVSAQDTPLVDNTSHLTPGQDGQLPSRLWLSAESWDFGTKFQGEPADFTIEIRNIGAGPLQFALKSSCGCTAITQLTQAVRLTGQQYQYQLDPGKSDTLKISYNTNKNSPNVSQSITLTTNDPEKPSVNIAVAGKIAQLYEPVGEEASNGTRIFFTKIGRDEKETKTLTLRNSSGEPVTLTLKPQEGPFDVALEEIKPGFEYKLTATTRPPLRNGSNMLDVTLETSHERMRTMHVQLNAFVQPRVQLNRTSLAVSSAVVKPFKQRVRVQYKLDRPLNVTGFEATHPGISAELLPPNTAAARGAAGYGFHDIEVTLPPASELPKTGGTLTILTDDDDPEYQKLEVKVIVVNRANPGGMTGNAAPPQTESPLTGTSVPLGGGGN
jgi:hypothetical protein